jgi:hypothetical protein
MNTETVVNARLILIVLLKHHVQVRCDQQIRAAVAQVRRTVCDVQIKDEVVVKKVKKDEALQNYRLQISNLAALESRIRRTFRDIEQVIVSCCRNRRFSLTHVAGAPHVGRAGQQR